MHIIGFKVASYNMFKATIKYYSSFPRGNDVCIYNYMKQICLQIDNITQIENVVSELAVFPTGPWTRPYPLIASWSSKLFRRWIISPGVLRAENTRSIWLDGKNLNFLVGLHRKQKIYICCVSQNVWKKIREEHHVGSKVDAALPKSRWGWVPSPGRTT